MLITASLACVGATPDNDALPTVSFSTATPGGHVSISLLTATATGQNFASGTTPIGPVATQTAAYGTSVAQTATAAVPTATIAGIFTSAERCPVSGTPTLPIQSPAFSRYPEIIVQYLSDGGAPTILEATLRSWGAVTEFGGLVRADRDFTGDGVPEVMALLYNPDTIGQDTESGELLIFGCRDEHYSLLFQSGTSLDRSIPAIHTADDMNGDFLNDITFSMETCGLRLCDKEVRIISWNVTLGSFSDLASESIIETQAEVIVSDTDEDGLLDVSVTSGIIRSPDAGPQRTATTVWKWDGVNYVRAEYLQAPVEYHIHLIHDGDDALLIADYDAAINFYRQGINDDLLFSWTYPNEAEYLKAFGQYRIMLAQIMKGDVGGAQETRDALVNTYIPPTPTPLPEGEEAPSEPTATPPFGGLQPGIAFARMADLFWQDFSANRDISRACEVVATYARSTPGAFEVLNSFGYANRQYTAEDICPF